MNTSTSTGRRTGSITATIQHAVFENNAGSKLVRQCHYDAAVKSFTSVLKILKPLAAIQEQQQHNDRFENHDDNGSSKDDDSSNDNADTTNSNTVPFKISFMNNNNTMIMDDDTEEDTTMTSTKETINDVSVVSPEVTASSSPEVSSSASYTHNKLIASKQHNCSNNNNGAASSPFAARKLKYFVFHDPVVIPPESLPSRSTSAATGMNTNDDDDNDDNFDELSLYSSEFFSKFLMIVMYNLALTLHLHALSLSSSVHSSSVSSSSGNTSSTTPTATTIKHIKKLFLRSRKLYELAFEMQLDADVDLLFTLALLNNLGLIYYTVKEKDRSTTCFKNMFSTMMYVMDSKESHSIIKEWDGLFANAMDILQIGNAVAASAA